MQLYRQIKRLYKRASDRSAQMEVISTNIYRYHDSRAKQRKEEGFNRQPCLYTTSVAFHHFFRKNQSCSKTSLTSCSTRGRNHRNDRWTGLTFLLPQALVMSANFAFTSPSVSILFYTSFNLSNGLLFISLLSITTVQIFIFLSV